MPVKRCRAVKAGYSEQSHLNNFKQDKKSISCEALFLNGFGGFTNRRRVFSRNGLRKKRLYAIIYEILSVSKNLAEFSAHRRQRTAPRIPTYISAASKRGSGDSGKMVQPDEIQ